MQQVFGPDNKSSLPKTRTGFLEEDEGNAIYMSRSRWCRGKVDWRLTEDRMVLLRTSNCRQLVVFMLTTASVRDPSASHWRTDRAGQWVHVMWQISEKLNYELQQDYNHDIKFAYYITSWPTECAKIGGFYFMI